MQKHDFNLVRGDDSFYRLVLRQKSDKELIDLTGCQLALQARDDDDNIVLDCRSETGELQVAEKGVVHWHIAHHQTANAEWQRATYDLQLMNANGYRKTILYGTLRLYHDRTRV